MFARIARFVVLCTPLLLAGCSHLIVGHWNMVECVPNKETLSIDNVWFKDGREYSAITTREGMTVSESGHYEYDGFKLHFRPTAGGQRTYNAALIGSKLELSDGARKVVLQKAP